MVKDEATPCSPRPPPQNRRESRNRQRYMTSPSRSAPEGRFSRKMQQHPVQANSSLPRRRKALVSIALGSNYYANARSALEAKATAGTDYFNTYAMTSYDEYFRSATLYANSFEDSASIELQFLDRNGHVEVSTRSLMTGSKPGTKDIIDALTSGRVSSFRGKTFKAIVNGWQE